MQMRDGFAGIRAIIEYEAEACRGEPEFFGDRGGLEEQMTEDLVIFGLGFGDARDRLFRNDQHMHGRLRFDIAKGDDFVVLVKDGSRDFARDNLLKESFVHA